MRLELLAGRRPTSWLVASALGLALAACGGGGGGGSAPPPTDPGSGSNPGAGGSGGSGGSNPGGGTTTAGYMQGTLIQFFQQTGLDFDDAYYGLGNDTLTKLPRSGASHVTGLYDQWYASGASGSNGDLVRVDTNDGVTFFDRHTLAQTSGGFSLAQTNLSITNQPHFWSSVKPSPDGNYLLAYWEPSYEDTAPSLTVFDRSGNVVQSINPSSYDSSSYDNAFDWLPDGRYIFSTGQNFVIATPGDNTHLTTTPLTLPPGTTGPWELSVSPDGTQVAVALGVAYPNSQGDNVINAVLYVTDLQGQNFRQLTTLTARAAADNIGSNVGHSNPVWSPDGKYIAFTVVYSQTATGNSPAGCQPFDVVPSDGQAIPIDGISDPDSMKFKINALSGSPTDAWACYRWTSWIATP